VMERVEIQDGDARQLPFPDHAFDVVVSSWALHNIYNKEERRKAICEIMRVLKPGGRIALMDIHHAPEYAQQLRESGFENVTLSGPRFTFLIPSRMVTAAKPSLT
jgi:arsenite methyltransferase